MMKRFVLSIAAGLALTGTGYAGTPTSDQYGSECASGGVFEGCGQGVCDEIGSLTNFGSMFGGLGGCLGDDDSGLNVGGWMQNGYTSESTGMFNNIPDRLNTHQAWIYAEKVADGSNGPDWGFRADFMYGIDSGDTQAFGNNAGEWDFLNGWDRGAQYGFALPQLYVEYANCDLSIKAGHFFTLIGYEVVPAPDNFFFSHAMTMFNSEPFTHTGMIATYNASDDVTVYGGWTLGWDTGFDQFGGGSNFLGGFSLNPADDITFTYMTTIGDMGRRGDGYSHSLVLDLQLTEDFNYVIQSDLVSLDPIGGGHNDEIGINQYLLYQVTDEVAAGARMEWWKSDAGFSHGGQSAPQAGSNSYYAATFGLNVKPADNIVIRPEFRYDWFPGSAGGGYEQGIFGVDTVLSF